MTLEERITRIRLRAERSIPDYIKGVNFNHQYNKRKLAQDALSIIKELQNKNKELEAQQEAETMYYESKNKDLTRLEVIDQSGRVYVNNNCKMELSYQDEGRTLKIFVNNEGIK